ncbi:rhamnogalacturonan acetylesterase RhgT [Abditibacteriota bacterium]|nr:rhamnogalacturonan acetylesterase RhgT [Abditibacteriota bacterium]
MSKTGFRTRTVALIGLAAVGLFALTHIGMAQTAPQEVRPNIPTLFVVGDSTARNNANGAQGWADPFKDYFDAAKVTVLNRAMAGRSSRTFVTEGRWDAVVRDLKAGDIVLLQMGHNDGGPIDTGRARASLPGLGEETRDVTKAGGTTETVHTYGWYMRKMIADTKAKEATPILMSLTVRNLWKDGHVERGSGNYRQQIIELAQSQKTDFVDVTNIIADHYDAMGQEPVKAMFGPDYVHTSPQGADLNATSVVAGLKALKSAPVANWLSDKGKAVAPYSVAVATGAAPPAQTTNAAQTTQRLLPVPGDPALPSLFLIGDSTVRNGQGNGSNGQWGWGEPIAPLFDAAKINVVNRAVGGLSSRTYLTGGFWTDTLAMVKPGDFVMMQFGHNDSSAVNDDSRARGTIRGIGEETQEIDNLLTHKHEVVHSYGWYLRKFISDAKAKGASVFVCSPIPRKSWTNGKINRNTDSYGGWAAEVATSEKVAFIPLNDLIAKRYDALGQEKVEPLFHGDSTHTSLEGAKINADAVVEGLKALPNNPLASYLLAATPVADAPATQALFRLNFGGDKAEAGYTAVAPDMIYSAERGFGFEPGTIVTSGEEGRFCTSDKPFYFSAALPEGNYTVSVTLGGSPVESTTTVKAELRRLMLEQVHTLPGQVVTRTFTVNLRTPQIATGGQVRLKDREKTSELWNWDDKLTLEFNGTHPTVSSIQIWKADATPTLYLLGDSTVCDQPQEPYNSWGQMLPRFFKAGIAIANNAESGESLRSSQGARRLDKVISTIKSGDYLFIQFGHNDMKEKGEGVGAFTTYKNDLKHYVDEARKKGGLPVLVTSMNRRTFDADGHITNSLGDYPEAVRQLASEEKLPLIDLNVMSKALYEAWGPAKSKLAFAPGDGTHHNNYGSYELAKCVVEGIRANKLGLVTFLTDDATPFDPAHPDALETFPVPASPQGASRKPDGN